MRNASGVGFAVGGIVESGQNMVEQVLHAGADMFEVALRRRRQIGAALLAVPSGSEAVITEPDGKQTGFPSFPTSNRQDDELGFPCEKSSWTSRLFVLRP